MQKQRVAAQVGGFPSSLVSFTMQDQLQLQEDLNKF